MDRLAVLNALGVAAIAALSCVVGGLGLRAALTGSAHAIPLLPQWDELGPTPAAQGRALASVAPVIIAALVAHQVGACCNARMFCGTRRGRANTA